MTHTSKYTIEERLIVSVWVHEKERTGETCEEIRENYFVSIKQLPVKPISMKPDLTTCDNWLWSYLNENISIIRMDFVEQHSEERERSSVLSERALPKCSGGQADGHGGAFNSAREMMVHIPKR